MHYTSVRDGKKENSKKEAKEISVAWFSFSQYTSILCKCIQNLKTLGVLGAEKSVTNKLYWKIKLQAMHHAPPHRDIFPMHFCSIRAENNLS